MRVIAIEEHLLPQDIVESVGVDLGLRAGSRAAALDDVGAGRLQVMDEAGIDVQVLSALSYFVQDLEPERSLPLHRRLNDRIARSGRSWPRRGGSTGRFTCTPLRLPTPSGRRTTPGWSRPSPPASPPRAGGGIPSAACTCSAWSPPGSSRSSPT